MFGSCHLDRASNVKIGVECQIFVIAIFFNCGLVLQFGALSRYQKGALTQKRTFLLICTAFRSAFHASWKNQNKHSTLNSSFDALYIWHEPNINSYLISSGNSLSGQECINIKGWRGTWVDFRGRFFTTSKTFSSLNSILSLFFTSSSFLEYVFRFK